MFAVSSATNAIKPHTALMLLPSIALPSVRVKAKSLYMLNHWFSMSKVAVKVSNLSVDMLNETSATFDQGDPILRSAKVNQCQIQYRAV